MIPPAEVDFREKRHHFHFPLGKGWRRLRRPGGVLPAFTLLEMVVALAILGVIVALLAALYSQVDRIITLASSERERSQSARTALEWITRELEQARYPHSFQTTQNGSTSDLFTNAGRFSLVIQANCAALSTNGGISGNGIFWRAPVFDYSSNAPTLAGLGYFVRWIEESDGVRPVLGRFYLPAAANATNVSGLTASTNWINASNVSEYAPMNEPEWRGWFMDNVLALWARPLDRFGNALTHYPNLTSRGVFTNLTNPASAAGGFNSLRGYREGTGGTNYHSDWNGLPAMLEVALVVSDSRAWKGNTNRFTVDPALTTNAANYWGSISNYVESLPPKIKRHVRVYSTRMAFPQAN